MGDAIQAYLSMLRSRLLTLLAPLTTFFLAAFPAKLTAAPLTGQALTPPRLLDDRLQADPLRPLMTPAPARKPSDRSLPSIPELYDEDLKENVALTEHILNQAMLHEDWSTLQRIMRFYPDMAGIDVVLRDYVQGALYRHDGRYAQAIALYRQLIAQHPDLDYVRLELGVMLMENKAWREADQQFAMVQRQPLDPDAQHDVAMYRYMMQREQQWQFQAGMGLAYNNNINSANKDPFLRLPIAGPEGTTFWLPFAKNPDALPQAAWGLKYAASAQREQSVGGNHFYTLAAEGDGVNHRHQNALSDQSITLRGGYKRQDVDSWFAVTPQVSKAWVGGKPYRHSHGLTIEAGYRPDMPWQFMGSFIWLKRHYHDASYSAYDGPITAYSLAAMRAFTPRLMAYGRAGMQNESARSGEYASRFPWLEVGASSTLGNTVGARFSIKYGHRHYKKPYGLFLYTQRRDREVELNATLWKPGLTLKGLQPRLYVSHKRNHSNLRMYARSQTELALMFEKRL